MRSIIHNPSKANERYTLPISKGGTGADNQEQAIRNLGGINLGSMNKPNGFAGLDIEGFLDPSVIPPGVTYGVPLNLYGPELIELNSVAKFEITNYDSFTDYNVVYKGVTGYREDEFIYVTATKRGTASIEVNGSFFSINIDGNTPKNTNIVGGEQINSFASQGPDIEFGSRLAIGDNGLIVIGSPGYNTNAAQQVGQITLFDNQGLLLGTLTGDPGPLAFEVSLSEGGFVEASTDAPGFVPSRITESGVINIPSNSSVLSISGQGAPGRTEWSPEVLGDAVIAFDNRTLPSKFYFEITAIKEENGNTKTTKFKSLILNNTSVSGNGIQVDVQETNTASVDVVNSVTRMNYRASYTQSYFEIQNGPVVFDSLRIRIYDDKGILQTGMVTDLSYVSTNSGTNQSTYTTGAIDRTRQGHVKGKFQHYPGGDTKVSGSGVLVTMKGGYGSPQGLTIPKIGNIALPSNHNVFVEFRYNSHPLSTTPCVLGSPITGVALNAPLNIGRGRDTVERELVWGLRQTTSGTTIRSGNGEVMMEFINDKIRITPMIPSALWQAAPSGVFVVEHTVGDIQTRTEFPMVQIGTDNIFEVAGLSYSFNNEFDTEYREAVSDQRTLNTTGGNRFGELFSIASTSDVLAVGIKKDALSKRGRVLVYQQVESGSRSSSYLVDNLPDATEAKLESLVISDEGDFLFSGYPEINTVVIHKRSDEGVYNHFTNIKTTTPDALFGSSIDVSAFGKIVAIVSKGNGKVTIYDNTGPVPVQLKQIDAPTGYTDFARVIRICSNGKVMAVSATTAGGQKVVRIYGIEETPIFIAEIIPPTSVVNFGKDFDLSPAGEVIAIGAPGSVTTKGQVFLFFNGSKNWEHYKTIEDQDTGTLFGAALSLSEDATKLVVSAPAKSTGLNSVGEVSLYEGKFQYLT